MRTIGHHGSRQDKQRIFDSQGNNLNKNLNHFKDVMSSTEERKKTNNSKIKIFSGGYFPQNDYKGNQSPKKKRRMLNIQDNLSELSELATVPRPNRKNDLNQSSQEQQQLDGSRENNQNEMRNHQIYELINKF